MSERMVVSRDFMHEGGGRRPGPGRRQTARDLLTSLSRLDSYRKGPRFATGRPDRGRRFLSSASTRGSTAKTVTSPPRNTS